MSYNTIYTTSSQNQLLLIKEIFKQNKITYRLLEPSSNIIENTEVKVQVSESDRPRAEALLRENGFLSGPDRAGNSVSMARLWIWLVIALIFLTITSVLINKLR